MNVKGKARSPLGHQFERSRRKKGQLSFRAPIPTAHMIQAQEAHKGLELLRRLHHKLSIYKGDPDLRIICKYRAMRGKLVRDHPKFKSRIYAMEVQHSKAMAVPLLAYMRGLGERFRRCGLDLTHFRYRMHRKRFLSIHPIFALKLDQIEKEVS